MTSAGTNAGRIPGFTGPLVILAAFLAILCAVQSSLVARRGVVLAQGAPVSGAWISPPLREDLATRTDHSGQFAIRKIHYMNPDSWIVAKEGFFLERVRSGTMNLDPVPQDHAESPWIDPTPGNSPRACGDCHRQSHSDWANSPHGLASGGKFFRWVTGPAKTPDATWNLRAKNPDALGACVACHAPGKSSLLAELPATGPLAGVHCDFCHKVKSLANGTLGLTHGRDMFQLARPAVDGRPVVFGPLKDSPRENVAYAPIFRQSQFCAPCHEGTVLGAKVYTTFSEWVSWGGGKTCQECHMRPVAPREHDHAILATHAREGGGLHHRLKIARNPYGVEVSLSLWTENVGHMLPTGHVDRHVVGWLEPLGPDGEKIPGSPGDNLVPTWATGLDRPAPGFLLARWQQIMGRAPRPFWEPGGTWNDTRLPPGKTREIAWRFPPDTRSVRLRVEHRKAWPEASRENSDASSGELLIAETYPVPNP